MLTINVSINAHLKKEFCLTYAKLGPTEFRIIAILINTLYMYSSAINQFSFSISLFDKNILLSSFDIMGIVVLLILIIIYITTIIKDLIDYNKLDPVK